MHINTADIVRFVSAATESVDFNTLKQAFSIRSAAETKHLKQLVKGLVEDGTVQYAHAFGRSVIQLSYDHPVSVSPHVILKPDACDYHPAPGEHVISLIRGAAFGGGEHPTTRLCISLMDDCLCSETASSWRETAAGLDIGTGSGVLALVAAAMGVKSVLAIDNSPLALHEARQNVCLNHLEEKIQVADQSAETISGCYGMVMANLRMPTLILLAPLMKRIVEAPGHVVLSGIKGEEELEMVIAAYRQEGFFPVKSLSEKEWKAVWLAG